MNDDVIEITEFAVAQLQASPGDVVIVRPPEGFTIEQAADLRLALRQWSESEGVFFHWLVVPPGTNVGAIVHPLDEVELQKAGAMDWPARPGEPRCAHGFIDIGHICKNESTGPHITKLLDT